MNRRDYGDRLDKLASVDILTKKPTSFSLWVVHNLIFNYIIKIMEPSIKCYNWIASKEGWRNNTYQDSVGIWTIGLGVRNDGFKYGKSISNERVIELFLKHVKSNASDVIKKWKKYFGDIEPLQNELDCMIAMKYQGAITYQDAANAIKEAGDFKSGMLNYIKKGRIVPITRKNETLKIFEGDFSNVKSYSTWEFNNNLIFDKNFNPHYPISANKYN